MDEDRNSLLQYFTTCLFLLLTFNTNCSFALANSDTSGFDVSHYHIKINVRHDNTYISGSTRITGKLNDLDLKGIRLELSSTLLITNATYNNTSIVPIHSGDSLWIPIIAMAGSSTFDITISYRGECRNTGRLGGVRNEFTGVGSSRATFCLSEPYFSKEWFPCKQILTDKADSVFIDLTVPASQKGIANGLLHDIVLVGDTALCYQWRTYYPTAYYAIAFSVSDYIEYTKKIVLNSGELLFQNFLYNNNNYLNENKKAIDETEDLLRVYEDLYGPYPFIKEKYGHVTAPLAGAMENQTNTMIVSFSSDLISHELAHSWFGNKVSCSSWNDIWINEGMATYAQYMAIEKLKPDEANDWIESSQKVVTTRPTGSIYIKNSELENEYRIFDQVLSYRKGALILHILRYELNNDSLFFSLMRDYLEKFSYSNASTTDFIQLTNEKTGRNVDTFFNEWYYGEGYPEFSIKWKYSSDTLTIESYQQGSSSNTPLFHTSMEFRVRYFFGDTLITLKQTQPYEVYKMHLKRRVINLVPDPNNRILKTIVIASLNKPESMVQLAPNPFTDSIFLHFNNSSATYLLEFYNIKGKPVFNTSTSSNFITISTRDWIPGIYFLKTTCNNQITINKIIKQ